MIKRQFKLILLMVFAVTLTLMVSGCGNDGHSLDGKNIVTFELSGGTMETKTFSTNEKLNFGYHPGTYILDPIADLGYTMNYPGYNFTGWYTDKNCTPNTKWNFKTPFNSETLTLYAGWEKAIKYTYTMYYVENGVEVALGSYDVKQGDPFNDLFKYENKRNGYTSMGLYSDKDLTTAWKTSIVHPGGETDCDIPVYVKYIAGEWTLVDTYEELCSAIESNKNVYVTADIDCGGEAIIDINFTTSYDSIFEGNGHKITNFKVNKKKGDLTPKIAIFDTLGAGAEIRNVEFTNVQYDFTGIQIDKMKSIKAAAIATEVSSDGTAVKIKNVSVTGTLVTNYESELTRLNSAVFTEDALVQIEEFTADIQIQIQK